MVQLKNQDPTNPMDSSEFLAQQAQFTQISELQKLNKNMTTSTVFSQASSVIGREVIAADPNTEEGYVQGVVDCASIDSKGNVMYLINGNLQTNIQNVGLYYVICIFISYIFGSLFITLYTTIYRSYLIAFLVEKNVRDRVSGSTKPTGKKINEFI